MVKNEESYVLLVVEKPAGANDYPQQSTDWTNFRALAIKALERNKMNGLEIEILAENAWLIPLKNGLPFAHSIKEAGNQYNLHYKALLVQQQKPAHLEL